MKKITFILMIGALFSACSLMSKSTKKAPPDDLFFVYEVPNSEADKPKLGYMDKTGKIVLGPWSNFEWNGKKYLEGNTRFTNMPFIEGFAGICFYDEIPVSEDNGKCGYIDKTGKLAIEPKYKKISFFSEGLAAVSEDGKKFGYIDATGKMVIEQKFVSLAPFSNGLAAAREQGDLKDGFIDRTGKYVIEKKYKSISTFGDGVTVVRTEDGKGILLDTSGKELKTLENYSVGNTDFYYKATNYKPFYGNLSEGVYAFDEFTVMPSFKEGLAMSYNFGDREGSIGYVKTDGEFEINLKGKKIESIRPFSEGFAPVGMKFDKKDELTELLGAEATKDLFDWVFIDRKGDFKVKPEDSFMDARPFSEGLAAVKERGRDGFWSYISTEFKAVTPACFSNISDFYGGLAYVIVSKFDGPCQAYKELQKNVGSTYIYIDKTGKPVKPQW